MRTILIAIIIFLTASLFSPVMAQDDNVAYKNLIDRIEYLYKTGALPKEKAIQFENYLILEATKPAYITQGMRDLLYDIYLYRMGDLPKSK